MIVADSNFAVITLWWGMQPLARTIWCITRWRLAAALYEPAPPRKPRQHGRPRLKGKRLPNLAQILTETARRRTTATVRG